VIGLEPEDYELVELITVSHQHFIITDPLLPDNPIVFVSWGLCELTGYTMGEILGRNCRFLQGPDTDKATVAHIRERVTAGKDCHSIVKNYTKSGKPFWNELFVAPLRDHAGHVVHFVGVQKRISDALAARLLAIKARHGQDAGRPGFIRGDDVYDDDEDEDEDDDEDDDDEDDGDDDGDGGASLDREREELEAGDKQDAAKLQGRGAAKREDYFGVKQAGGLEGEEEW
jgi:PAS domain S-box-containing protein